MKTLLFAAALLVFTAGCFLKPVKTAEADDIIKAQVIQFEGKPYLIMHEAIFQATYKESRQGISFTSGYNDLRLSVYDLNDGSLLARRIFGSEQKSAVAFLGYSDGNIWLFSQEEKVHSLDPLTLESKVTSDDIVRENPVLKDNFAECEKYQFDQYFKFNLTTDDIIITDRKGYRYLMNTATLKAERTESQFEWFGSGQNKGLVSSASLPGVELRMVGDLRKQVGVNGKVRAQQLTFLDGMLIADLNVRRNVESLKRMLEEAQVRAMQTDSAARVLQGLNGGRGPEWRTPQRDTLRELEARKYELERLVREYRDAIRDFEDRGYSHRITPMLSPGASRFFVFHRLNTAKDSRALITLMQLQGDTAMDQIWGHEAKALFYDPSAASETNAFKQVFSKGSPEFDFSYFELADDRLVIVWMLHVYCLSISDGSVLWHFRV